MLASQLTAATGRMLVAVAHEFDSLAFRPVFLWVLSSLLGFAESHSFSQGSGSSAETPGLSLFDTATQKLTVSRRCPRFFSGGRTGSTVAGRR
jgi:hypothetical protein